MTDGMAPPAVPPPPPMWMPVSPAMTTNYWPLLAFWGRVLGFVLLFVGTIVLVIWGNFPYNCISSTGGCSAANISGYESNLAIAVLASKLIWAIGLFFLGSGAGVKLHWVLKTPRTTSSEDVAAWVADRRLNGLLVLFAIVLLLVLLLSAPGGFIVSSVP